jgi:hypothetical protein
MAALWSLCPTPAAMLVLQIALFWTGLALVARAARSPWPLIIGLSPIAVYYLGIIGKDTLLASALMLGAGLCSLGWRWTGAAVLLVGGFLRANAGFALGPLLFKRIWLAAVFGVLMLGLVALSSRAVERTGVERGLQLFDLAGIDHFEGGNRFPEGCYTSMLWDTLSTGRCGHAFQRSGNVTGEWISAIVRHPVAYAEHRIAHFNRATFFLVPPAQQCVEAPELHDCPVSARSDFITKNALFWPCLWLAVGIALLFMPGLGGIASALSWSALVYGFSYAVVGVASDFRYFLWSEIAVQMALVLAWRDGVRLRTPALVGAAVVVLGYAARVMA